MIHASSAPQVSGNRPLGVVLLVLRYAAAAVFWIWIINNTTAQVEVGTLQPSAVIEPTPYTLEPIRTAVPGGPPVPPPRYVLDAADTNRLAGIESLGICWQAGLVALWAFTLYAIWFQLPVAWRLACIITGLDLVFLVLLGFLVTPSVITLTSVAVAVLVDLVTYAYLLRPATRAYLS